MCGKLRRAGQAYTGSRPPARSRVLQISPTSPGGCGARAIANTIVRRMSNSLFPSFSRGRAASLGQASAAGAGTSALQGIHIRGSAIAPTEAFVVKAFDSAAWAQCRAELEPEFRALIEQPVIATNWYPFPLALAIIDWLSARGGVKVLRDYAIHNLDFATNFVFRAIFKIGSPEFMIARSDQVWKKFYSHGRMACEVSPGRARIELHDFPYLSANYERLLTHCMEAVLLKAGARRVHAQQTRSHSRGEQCCEFSYTWDAKQ